MGRIVRIKNRAIYFGVVLVLLGLMISSPAYAITIDFETLTDSEAVTTQFSGLTFSNTTVLTAGSSLNELEFPPSSGVNVVSGEGVGPIQIDFASAVLSVSGRFTYAIPLTLTAFDSSLLNPVATSNSLFDSNQALSGDLGSSANELLTLNYAGGISRVLITDTTPGGGFFFSTLDDLTYTAAASVPEPSTLLLLGSGLVGLIAWRRKRMAVT